MAGHTPKNPRLTRMDIPSKHVPRVFHNEPHVIPLSAYRRSLPVSTRFECYVCSEDWDQKRDVVPAPCPYCAVLAVKAPKTLAALRLDYSQSLL